MGKKAYASAVKATLDANAKTIEFRSTAPASCGLFCANRRAAIVCVPTEIAESEPPNIQSRISEGKS